MESVQVFGLDTETGEARSIWLDHRCTWRLWVDGDDGYDETAHDGVYGCFLVEDIDTVAPGEAIGPGDDHASALITLSMGQFIIVILSVL